MILSGRGSSVASSAIHCMNSIGLVNSSYSTCVGVWMVSFWMMSFMMQFVSWAVASRDRRLSIWWLFVVVVTEWFRTR